MSKLTIRAKLIALATTVAAGLLAMGAISQYGMGHITALHHAELGLQEVMGGVLGLRRHEKDFLARADLRYRDKFNGAMGQLNGTLDRLRGVLEAEGMRGAELDQLAARLREYGERFTAVVALAERLGLDEKSGLRGGLRKAVHEAEDALKALGNDRLTKDMLTLRRNEKDFLLRKDMKYLDKFERNFTQFETDFHAGAPDAGQIEAILARMTRYRTDFRALVAGYGEQGLNPQEGLLGEMRATVHQTETLLEKSAAYLEKAVEARTTQVERMTLFTAAGIAVALILLIMLIARSILRPVEAAVACMNDIAEGEGDLTVCLDGEAGDELAALGGAFNTFTAKISDLIRRMAGAADDARDQADEGRSTAARAVTTINALATDVKQATEVTRRLAEESGNIGAVLDVIGGIAEQTNLLALNAAIEAARAGEQGRGFAVVADEVRTLASRTQHSTGEIKEMIDRLRHGVDEAVRVMDASHQRVDAGVDEIRSAGTALEGITAAVKRINEMNRHIADATEGQRQAVGAIGDGITHIRDVSEETAHGARQTAQSGDQLARLATDLNGLVTQFKV